MSNEVGQCTDFSAIEAFKTAFKGRIALLDGAMGTMIQSEGLEEADYRGKRFLASPKALKGNHDLLCLTRPEIILNIHKQFLIAGADIIETNSFNANAISQSDYGTASEVYSLNVAAAQLARAAADEFSKRTPEKPRWVAGSIGPTNRTASLSPKVDEPAYRNVSFDELVGAYTEQISGLIEGGVDLLLIETIFDTLNARAALYAAESYFERSGKALPIMVSGTVTDKSGRTLSGQTLPAFVASMKSRYVVSIGLNCAFGAKELVPYIKDIARLSNLMISVYPNAGLPNQLGLYEELPADTAGYLSELIDQGWVNIVGGCCGTRPEHIEAVSRSIQGKQPRQQPFSPLQPMIKTQVAGLECVEIDPARNFVNIGERTNVAGSAKFARLIREGKHEEALSVALEQVENGAQIIDINFDDGLLDAVYEMTHFLRLIASEPEVSKVPIMIDSSRWEVLEAGLKAIQGKAIVNSISLKSGEAVFLEQAKVIQRHGAAVVVMAFDEQGQADSFERKIRICERAYGLLRDRLDFPPEDIIFDANILAIGTGIEAHAQYAKDFIDAVAWIKANLPYAKTSGGLSNLSFSFRGNHQIREAIHSAFLLHAIHAGLDMAILNPGMIQIYDEVEPELLKRVEDLIFNRHEMATEALVTYGQTLDDASEKVEGKRQAWREATPDQRLIHALVKGVGDFLEEDLQAAKGSQRKALELIEGPLMSGMRQVGSLFGEGKMFLPQVVKTARVMKKAVTLLQPAIEAENTQQKSSTAGKVVIATVKGDVHDIGKNIVGIVLQCNNFEVIDLGIMVEPEVIVETAIREKADIVALSGLITPSLEEMVEVAKQMQRAQLTIPLMIGGATTSKLHTALKIAPAYAQPVIYSSDAPQAVSYAKRLLNPSEKEGFVSEVYASYEAVSQVAHLHASPLISLEAARQSALPLIFEQQDRPNFIGTKTIENVGVKQLLPYIDWTFFFTAWEMKLKYPEVLHDEKYGKEAQKLLADGKLLLERHRSEIRPKAVLGIYEACSRGDDVVLKHEGQEVVFHCFRQQKAGSDYRAMGDYLCKEDLGLVDYAGGFAVTAGKAVEQIAADYKRQGDDYSALLIRTLGDRLAEAYAEYLHQQVRCYEWGYDSEEALSMAEIHNAHYRGIRPAFGYPSLIDHSEKQKLFDWMAVERRIGISLTEGYMMTPVSSVCGLYFAHKEAKYFELFHIGEDQVEAVAGRSGRSKAAVEQLISTRIKYK